MGLDVTRREESSSVPELRAQLEVRGCNVTDQTEAVENSSPWTEEGAHWLISVWGGSSAIQAKAPGQISEQVLLSVAMI